MKLRHSLIQPDQLLFTEIIRSHPCFKLPSLSHKEKQKRKNSPCMFLCCLVTKLNKGGLDYGTRADERREEESRAEVETRAAELKSEESGGV